jgi:hypothetical protein
MSAHQQSAAESAGAMLAKAAPPASVSVATIAGVPISDLVLWATLIYTLLMIVHKMMSIWRDMRPCRIEVEE